MFLVELQLKKNTPERNISTIFDEYFFKIKKKTISS